MYNDICQIWRNGSLLWSNYRPHSTLLTLLEYQNAKEEFIKFIKTQPSNRSYVNFHKSNFFFAGSWNIQKHGPDVQRTKI